MSQTNTNTNNSSSNTNQNQISGRGGRGQGSGGRDCGGRSNNYGNNSIAKYLFDRKMKDGRIFKLIITKTRHRATQYKNIIDTLPVFCTEIQNQVTRIF